MNTVKVKTADLEGAALDYAVSKAVNDSRVYVHDGCVIYDEFIEQHGDVFPVDYSPSTDWSQGGVLIEENRLEITFNGSPEALNYWCAYFCGQLHYERGPTPLIAACRAIVASIIGDEVEIPEELLK